MHLLTKTMLFMGSGPRGSHRGTEKTIFLAMRLAAVFLFIACMQVSAAGYSQRVSLSQRNAPLEKVFKDIRRQTGYLFLYGNKALQNAKKVDIEVKDASLEEVLNQCFKDQPFTYAIVEKTIVVRPRLELDQPSIPIPLIPPAEIHGKVTDAKGNPLQGVSVLNKKSKKGTKTDTDGNFITRAAVNDVLEFSFVGYKSVSFKIISPESPANISLEVEISSLNEMVLVGYGSTRRKDLTGSVASVNTEEIKNTSFTSIDQALAGKAAGVQVVQADGSPGGVAKIRIRGGTSLLGGNDPLYIIDGVQVTIQNRYIQSAAEIVNPVERFGNDDPNSSVSGAFGRGLNSLGGLNINDIESIDILKDASATAIYGSKAANGVIIITTKKGKLNQKPVLEGNYYTGFSRPIKQKLLNADQYKAIMKEGAKNLNDARAAIGMTPDATATSILTNPDFLGTGNTDWLGLVSRTGISNNADISVRGGGSGSRYYTSLSYTKQTGVLLGSDFSRISGKTSLDNEISSRLRIITNLDYGFTKNNITNGIYAEALYAPPTLHAYNADGSPYQFDATAVGGYGYEGYQNPLVLLSGINEAKTTSLIGSLSGEYDILKELKFRSTVSVNYNNYHQLNYIPSTALIAAPSGVAGSNGGTGTQAQTEDVNVFYENTLTWDRQFNKDNRINLLAGTSWQKYNYNSFSASGQGFPNDKFLNGLSSAAVPLPPTNSVGQNSLLSFYLRLNYAWKERYLITFTGRSDASSKFPANNRVGYFPSAGIAWRMTEEKFMKKLSWLDELKFRASAGYTGTQNIGDNLFYTLYTPGSYAGTNALIPTQLGNEKIKWESTLQKDLGIDFSLFKSRLRGAIGYYQKNTTGLLLVVPVAPSSAYSSVIGNIANIRNKGVEIDLRGDFIRHKDFQWSGAINISGNRSKVLHISNDFSNPNDPSGYNLGNAIVREGKPLGLFYGNQFKGIIRTQKQLDDYKAASLYARYGLIPYIGIGDAMYGLDSNGLYKQDVIGNAEPKFYGGYTNTFTYKNISLIALLTFSYGGDILYTADIQNHDLAYRTNKGVGILDHWTPETPNSNNPRLMLKQSAYTYTSSNNVYKGSYLKLKSVTLNYDLPKSFLDRLKLRQASLYASAINLFTITHYPGPDPEVSNNPYSLINGSSDAGGYPTIKQYSIGARFGF